MEKLLTVSIASYNIEKYLRQALESCIFPEALQNLEVFIVDDGSKDHTADIGREFMDKYPDTFHLISKENGGYGSTVNYSMEHATGRYFKLLDGDDWFNEKGLKSLLKILSKTDADLVLNRYETVTDGTYEKKLSNPGWAQYEGSTLPISKVKTELVTGIWQTTIKTDILKKHPFKLPEHTLYTDQLFVVYSLPYVEKICFSKASVYCYRVGRDGQSVSKENRIKHSEESLSNVYAILDFYASCDAIDDHNRTQIRTRVWRYYYNGIRTLLLLPRGKEPLAKMKKLERYTSKHAHDVYAEATHRSRRICLLRYTGYLAYYLLGGREKNWS